jgi:hypothetical protein
MGFGLSLLTGCIGFVPDWRPLPVEGLYFDQLWSAAEESVVASGHAIDFQATDRIERRMTSRWRTRLDAFGKGQRTRAQVRIFTDANDNKKHELEYHIERQANKEMSRFDRPRESDWSDNGQDQGREELLRQHLEMRLQRMLKTMQESPSKDADS